MHLRYRVIVSTAVLLVLCVPGLATAGGLDELVLVEAPSRLPVGDRFELRLLQVNENNSFQVVTEGIDWTFSVPSRLQVSGDVATAITPGSVTIAAKRAGLEWQTNLLVCADRCDVDGELADWLPKELANLTQGATAPPQIQTNYPNGEWRTIPLSQAQLLDTPESLVVKRMGARYTELGIDIAIEFESAWPQSVGVWIDLKFRDALCNRIVALPDFEVARTSDDEILGGLATEYVAYSDLALEVRIPWRDLALTSNAGGLLQSVMVRFHADVLSDQGVWLHEILAYELPARDITAIALHSGSESAGTITASQFLPAPGDLVSISANYVDAFGRLWSYEPREYSAIENCEATDQGVRPMSDGDVSFKVDVWPESIHIVARGLCSYDTSLLFPCRVADCMPVAVEWKSDVDGARFAWFDDWPTQADVLSYDGPWNEEAAFTQVYASNRGPLQCSVLAMSQDGTTRWLANESVKTFVAGGRILLDGSLLSDDGAHSWEQDYGERNGMEYVTQNVAELLHVGDGTSFIPEWPGIYRFRLGKDFVDVRVDAPDSMRPTLQGVLMFDYFGDWDKNHIFGPDRLEWAAEYVRDLGANVIAVMNCAAYESWDPLPSLQRMPEQAILDNWEIELLSERAREAGLGMMLFEQQYSTLEAPRGTWNKTWQFIYRPQSPEWYDAWFEDYTEYILAEAVIAEECGVPSLMISWSTPGAIFSRTEQWRRLIAKIRDVYSGEIGTYMRPHSMEDISFLADVDFALAAVDSFDEAAYEDPANPTVEEIRDGFVASLSAFEKVVLLQAPELPIYSVLTAASCDAQNDFAWAEPFPADRMDLREQVAYYEGFLEAVAIVESVSGAVLFGGAWFEGLDFKGDYFDTYSGISFTGKPAENVARLWFGDE